MREIDIEIEEEEEKDYFRENCMFSVISWTDFLRVGWNIEHRACHHRHVPVQDRRFALILWYVAKTLYWSY